MRNQIVVIGIAYYLTACGAFFGGNSSPRFTAGSRSKMEPNREYVLIEEKNEASVVAKKDVDEVDDAPETDTPVAVERIEETLNPDDEDDEGGGGNSPSPDPSNSPSPDPSNSPSPGPSNSPSPGPSNSPSPDPSNSPSPGPSNSPSPSPDPSPSPPPPAECDPMLDTACVAKESFNCQELLALGEEEKVIDITDQLVDEKPRKNKKPITGNPKAIRGNHLVFDNQVEGAAYMVNLHALKRVVNNRIYFDGKPASYCIFLSAEKRVQRFMATAACGSEIVIADPVAKKVKKIAYSNCADGSFREMKKKLKDDRKAFRETKSEKRKDAREQAKIIDNDPNLSKDEKKKLIKEIKENLKNDPEVNEKKDKVKKRRDDLRKQRRYESY